MRCKKLLRSLFCAPLLAFAVSPQIHSSTNVHEAELALKKFQLAPGLKAELFAAEPHLQNPVAFTLDERGRAYVVETHRYRNSIFDITEKTGWLLDDMSFRTVQDRTAFFTRTFATNLHIMTDHSEILRLVEDKDGDGRAESSTIFADGFNEIPSGTAAGVLSFGTNVWFACIPTLVQLSDGDQDGKSDFRQSLHSGFGVHIGVTGHDLHGVEMGPDGRIYFSIGDRGFNVRANGQSFEFPDTGGVLRCNPDGSELEVFAIGLRNPQELTFDHYGNLWTGDNDTAGEDKSRVVYVVEGGDYGWRCSYQHMPGFGPWVQERVWEGNIDDVLPNAGTVAQGPSGLDYNPGTGLSAEYHNRFLVCDFPGGIFSFAVKPNGASYTVSDQKKFLWNLWPTDVEFGPDGSVYISDWVSGWTPPGKGRLYRVSTLDSQQETLASEVKNLLASPFDEFPPQRLAELLSHADQRVRIRAQFALVAKNDSETLENTLASSRKQFARIHAIWGLGQLARKQLAPVEPLIAALEDLDPEVRAQAAKMLGDAKSKVAVQPLSAMLKDAQPRVRFFAATALGKIKDRKALEPVFAFLRENQDKDPYLRHAGVIALTSLAKIKELSHAANDHSFALRRAALLAMRRLKAPQIARFLHDSDPLLVMEAARAINDVPITPAFSKLAALTTELPPTLPSESNPTNTSTHATLRRALNAHFRLGEPKHAQALANFASDTRYPLVLRTNALHYLTQWEAPYPLDSIMGLWRPLPARKPATAAKALKPQLAAILQSDEECVQLAALRAIASLQITGHSEAILNFIQTPSTSAQVQGESLKALGSLKDDRLSDAVRIALASTNKMLRAEGVRWIGELNLPNTAALLADMLNDQNDIRLSQAALNTLGKLQDPQADSILAEWLGKHLDHPVRPELHLELIEAAERRSSSQVTSLVAQISKAHQSVPLGKYQLALRGGDAVAGRRIFTERGDVACLRCHKLGGEGGTVGPTLDGIGRRYSREQLLESVLLPNQTIAPGFENVVVTLKGGSSHAGLIKKETSEQLILESPEDGEIKIPTADITSRQRGLSAMPEGIDQFLSKRDLRNLIEFLATLR